MKIIVEVCAKICFKSIKSSVPLNCLGSLTKPSSVKRATKNSSKRIKWKAYFPIFLHSSSQRWRRRRFFWLIHKWIDIVVTTKEALWCRRRLLQVILSRLFYREIFKGVIDVINLIKSYLQEFIHTHKLLVKCGKKHCECAAVELNN